MLFRIEVVLVADDLSDDAATVVRGAGALAALAEAELHVVHALEPRSENGGASNPNLQEVREAVQRHLGEALPADAEVHSSHVAPGLAHEVILGRAQEVGADLLVIGPHRGQGAATGKLGTTADILVRMAAVPCLILRSRLSLPLRRILVPSDLSRAANRALDLAFVWGAALRVPSSSGGETYLDVLHVLPPSAASHGEKRRTAAERDLRQQVAAAGGPTRSASMLKVETTVVHGTSAPDTILRLAEDNHVDLLVLGTQGQRAENPGVIGSISSSVAQRAERPVLLVPPALHKGD